MNKQRGLGPLGRKEINVNIENGTVTIPLTDIKISFEVVERLYIAIKRDLKKRRTQNINELNKSEKK